MRVQIRFPTIIVWIPFQKGDTLRKIFQENKRLIKMVKDRNPSMAGGWAKGEKPRFSLQFDSSEILDESFELQDEKVFLYWVE